MKPIYHALSLFAFITACLCAPVALPADTFGLETLNLQFVEQGWGEPHANQSVDGHEGRYKHEEQDARRYAECNSALRERYGNRLCQKKASAY